MDMIEQQFAMSKFASAAARSAALMDELIRLRGQMESQRNEWLSWAEKRDALEHDAARYQFVKSRAYVDGRNLSLEVCIVGETDTYDDVDALVDSAMEAQQI